MSVDSEQRTVETMVRHAVVDGIYLRERRPAGPPRGVLLYLHGLGESGLCFERLLAEPRLDAWHHLAPDLPGYGKSPRHDTVPDFAARAAFLEAFFARLETGPAVVLGHSMGGVLGTLLCARSGFDARAFVNVEGNLSFDDCTASLEVASQHPSAFLAGGVDALRDDVSRRGLDDAAFRGYAASLALCDPRTLYRDSVELVAASRREDLAAAMGRLEIPKHYLLGDPRGTGRLSRFLLNLAGVSWRAIDDAGHWPFVDRHDVFVDALTSFLEELP